MTDHNTACCSVFLPGIYGGNPLLIEAVMILGIGHIGIHSEHRKELQWRVGHFIIAPHANLYHNGRVLQSVPRKVYFVPGLLKM